MHRGQLSQVQLQGMIRNVAAGMKYLIEQGYLHRDLQCAHLAVSANLTVKIAEFSQARRLAETFVPTVRNKKKIKKEYPILKKRSGNGEIKIKSREAALNYQNFKYQKCQVLLTNNF